MRKVFPRYPVLSFVIVGFATAALGLGVSRARGVVVDVVPVQSQSLVQTILASGRIMSPARVDLGAVITGRVERVLVHEGEVVTAGQVLIELETHELTAALRQAEASEHYARARVATVAEVSLVTAKKTLAQAKTTLAWTERELHRGRSLLIEGVMSQAKFEDIERAYDIAKSQFEAARTQMDAQTTSGAQAREAAAKLSEATAAHELATAKLAQTRIRASADSTVLTRQVEPGDIVQPGRTLLTLATSGETRISAQIDEKNLPYLKVGNAAVASADAFPDIPFTAELYYLAPGIDVGRGTVEARFRVLDPPPHLRADMTLSVEIHSAHDDHAIVVPSAAVRSSTNGHATVLTVQEGKAVSQPVAVGFKTGSTVEIRRGIQAGDLVIVNTTVQPGARVRPRLLTVENK